MQKDALFVRARAATSVLKPALYGALAVVGLTASLLVLPASGPLATALHTPVAETAPEGAQRGCPPQVSRGSRGDYVEYLQILLGRRLGQSIPVDGIFGDTTHTAVTHWQTVSGLHVDGVAGPQTWRSLGAC